MQIRASIVEGAAQTILSVQLNH